MSCRAGFVEVLDSVYIEMFGFLGSVGHELFAVFLSLGAKSS